MKHKSADNKNQKPRTIEEATQLYLSKKKREKEIAEMSKKIAEEIAREEAAQKAADKKRAEEDEALRKEEEKKKAEEDTKKDPDEDKIEEIDPYEDNKQEDKKKESYMSGSIKKSAAAKYGSTRKRAEAGISTTSPYGLDDLEGIVHGDTLDDGDIETVIKRLLDDVGEPTLARDSMYGMAEPSMAEPSMAELSMAEPSMAELSMSEPSMKDITWGAPQLSYGPKSPEDAQVELIRELISGNNKNIFKGTNKAEMDEFIKGFIKHVNHPDYNEQDSGDSGKKDTYDWHDMSDHGGTGHEDSANAAILDWADDATKHIEDPQERRSEKARLFYQRVYGEDQEKSKQNSFDEDKKKESNIKRFSALEKYLSKTAALDWNDPEVKDLLKRRQGLSRGSQEWVNVQNRINELAGVKKTHVFDKRRDTTGRSQWTAEHNKLSKERTKVPQESAAYATRQNRLNELMGSDKRHLVDPFEEMKGLAEGNIELYPTGHTTTSHPYSELKEIAEGKKFVADDGSLVGSYKTPQPKQGTPSYWDDEMNALVKERSGLQKGSNEYNIVQNKINAKAGVKKTYPVEEVGVVKKNSLSAERLRKLAADKNVEEFEALIEAIGLQKKAAVSRKIAIIDSLKKKI